ncbi:hypothetical protein [uncultured Tenacibaculum sp.]|uniref:hypothetical protein n=1 Tax=uncultured Tenacibaculum sp. TaxID=174713 RepID=UPI002626664A|nr:hypothetical protein [uncultured Tenacibaculum sp.]
MKNGIKLIVAMAMFAFVACSDSNSDNLPNTPLQGKVFGASFTAKGGKAFKSGINSLSVHITNLVAACDSNISDYELEISTDIEIELGVFKKNIVFSKKGETPLNFLNGTVEMVSFANNELTLKVRANSNTNNTVEGTFTVPFCQ